jgi:hypothetical protein
MNVSDRIMGDCRSYYRASAAIDDMEEEEFNKSKVRQPDDLIEVQTRYRSTYDENLEDKDREERERKEHKVTKQTGLCKLEDRSLEIFVT